MKRKDHPFTLITGASSGLGKALAVECARQHRHLLLVALPGSRLALLARQLAAQNGITALSFEVDLSDQRQLQELTQKSLAGYRIDFLINNAGVGGTRELLSADADYLNRIIDVNIRAPTLLIRSLLPTLLQEEEAYILNISSIAALSPTPFKTIYPASKTFLRYFSLALSEELAGTGVYVSVAFPGGILSNFDSSYRILQHGWLVGQSIVPASDLARHLLRKTLRRQKVIYPGLLNRLGSLLLRLLPPEMKAKVSAGLIRKELGLNQAA